MNRKEDKHEVLVNMPYMVLHVLLRNKALDLYCNNALSAKANFLSSIYYTCSNNPLVWLNSAFYWKYTPEGREFWVNIFEQAAIKIKRGL